ncbi:MAG: hypothetical protein QM831_06620 [Kofleriaceae bacterium]
MADNVQDRFKLFIGALDDAGQVNDLAKDVIAWAAKEKVSPKSVGCAVSKDKLMLTIGYREGDEPAEVELHSMKIGRVGTLDADELSRFTRAIESGGMNWPPVIGHTLYVTKNNDLYLVILTAVEKREDE